ncbi:MAG: SCO family protein [Thermoleophilia bacterium]|nr:SCO family protein [Thermoleophilia bacterium]
MSGTVEPRPTTSHRRQAAILAVFLAALAGIGIGIGIGAHFLTRGTAAALDLPEFHGQANWNAQERRAAPFTLHDHRGAVVSLDALKGTPVLLTFLDSRCREQCPIEGSQLGTILRDIKPEARPALLVVSVNPAGDTPASIRKAMAQWRLTGPWRWHWLRGTERDLSPVWDAYGIAVHPTTNDITHGLTLYLIDRDGFQRTGYLFPFLPNVVARDVRTLTRA